MPGFLGRAFGRQFKRNERKRLLGRCTEDDLTCYKCNTLFLEVKSLRNHSNRCRGTGTQPADMSYTRSEMNQSIRGGPLSVVNNSNIGDAYRNQLFNQPSLLEAAQQRRIQMERELDGNDSGERMDDDESFNGFDPMADDIDNDSNPDEQRDDNEDLPLKYRNKMKRYNTNKYKTPEQTTAPDNFSYTGGNVMGTQATAYAELLKICQKHHADKSLFDDIQRWATFWSERDANVFKEQSLANRWSRKKLMKFLKNVFPFEGMAPKSILVELHDARKVTVPQVDFANSANALTQQVFILCICHAGINGIHDFIKLKCVEIRKEVGQLIECVIVNFIHEGAELLSKGESDEALLVCWLFR
jgi:hypothetical protein